MNAIITGATRGIGRAIAVKLAEKGYDLGLCARNEKELAELKSALAGTGVRICTSVTDCGSREQVYGFCAAMEKQLGDIDVLVNNVGVFLPGSLLDETDECFESQQQINLNAAYYLSKYFGRRMRSRRSGHLFTICSVAARQVVPDAGSYSVTKSALLSLNHVLRQELADHNVKVTAILPGPVLTSSWTGTTIPDERFIQPEDVAMALAGVLELSSGANVEEIILRPLMF